MAAKWLKKLGKIASIAAPIIAAPFTGGTSLALIGAGAGALGGLASGGGLKGALLGAGMGAIPVPGAAGSAKALGLTTSEAIKRGLLNPQALTRIGGAALDGRAGTLASLASGFLPGAGIYQGVGSKAMAANAGWQGAPYNGPVMGMGSAPLFGPGAVNTGAWTTNIGAAPSRLAVGGPGAANTGAWTTNIGAAPPSRSAGAVGGIGAANTGAWTTNVGAAPPSRSAGAVGFGPGAVNTGVWTSDVGAPPGAVGGIGAANTGAWTSDVGAAPTGGKMGFSLGNLFKGFTGRDKATLGVGGLNAVLDYRGKGNQLSADERALEYQRKSDAEMRALLAAQRDEDYQRELIKEAALQKRFDAEQLALQTRSDAQEKRLADQYNAREARMSPYREAGRTSLARIANIQAPTITPYTPSLVYRS